MITIEELILDEQDAIRKYSEFLTYNLSPKLRAIIKEILGDEKDHHKKLSKFK